MDLSGSKIDLATHPKIEGSCNCGRHKMTIPKPDQMNLCHCLDCRKWAGAMHSAHMFVQSEHIDNHGSPEPKVWTTSADSGTEMKRAWCPDCGAGLWIKTANAPDMTFVKAGLFEPKDIPNPTMENWLKNKQDWETPAHGTKRQSDVN